MKFISNIILHSTLLLTFVAPLSAQTKAADTPKGKLHIYLLIGQSNMAGRAAFSKDDAEPIPHCYLLNGSDQWEAAKNPLNRYSTIRKDLKFQKMSPGYTFAKTMLEKQKGITIGLVANAKGGTKIAQWGKGTEFYTEAVKRVKEAQKTGTLKGILWHQGEGDSRRSSTYLKSLEKLISDLRKDLDVPQLPFIAGQVFYDSKNKPNTKKINKQISKLPATVAFTDYVSSRGLTTHDHTHFDTKGMKEIGKRYAEKMIQLQAKADRKP